jgi:hypothetical protein
VTLARTLGGIDITRSLNAVDGLHFIFWLGLGLCA